MTLGDLLLFWNTGQTGQADYFSDSDIESICYDDVEDTANEFWPREELLDKISQEVISEETPVHKIKTKVSKEDALNLTKKYKMTPVEAARKLLSEMSENKEGDETYEKRLLLEVDHLARKIRRLQEDDRKKKFRGKPEMLEEDLASYSQNSFIKEKQQFSQDLTLANEDFEMINAEVKEQPFRKKLRDCKDFDYVLERTRPIYHTLLDEAARQGCDLSELAGLLMYRYLYVTNRCLSYQMLQLYKTGTMTYSKVNIEKALAILERRRLTKEGYRCLRRLLKPDGLRMPPYEEVARLKHLITPPLRPYYHVTGLKVGVCTGLADSLGMTVRRMIQAGSADFLAAASTSLVAGVSVGTDGAGGQKEYRQQSGIGVSSTHTLSSLYQLTEVSQLATEDDHCIDKQTDPDHDSRGRCFWCSTSVSGLEGGGEVRDSPDMFDSPMLDVDDAATEGLALDYRLQKPVNYQERGDILWVEQQMSSPRSARPLLVALLRETRVSVGEFIREYQEHEVRSLTTYSRSVNFSPGSWVLWSPRGRVIVEKEDCKVVSVKSRTVLVNPVRSSVKTNEAEVEHITSKVLEKQEEDRSPRLKKMRLISEPGLNEGVRQQDEADLRAREQQKIDRRRKAFFWMQDRGDLANVSMESKSEQQIVSVCNKFTSLLQ